MIEKIRKTTEQWAASRTAEEFRATREYGAQGALSGALWDHHEAGKYHRVCGATALFGSENTCDSGAGWPSCEAQRGPLFKDGTDPTSLRFCIDSASLTFVAVTAHPHALSAPPLDHMNAVNFGLVDAAR